MGGGRPGPSVGGGITGWGPTGWGPSAWSGGGGGLRRGPNLLIFTSAN